MNKDALKFLNQEIISENGISYTITEYISEGGNGFVFECINSKGGKFVLKLLHTTNQVKIQNFKKEIKLQKNINSRFIVKCIDSGEKCFGKQKTPRPFYIMKKYDSTLEELINGNQITPLKAYRYSIQLCKAIKVLHKHKDIIIHRDLKPENILYDKKNDIVMICDFGLAHLEINNTTINEGFVGNIDYHAPEQKLRGKSKVGTYTDIYSLGLIINVLFTKEIAQGENYLKIWQVEPYFSFLDDIVARMINHNISTREHDINCILIELEKHEMEYEVEESFLKVLYKDKEISKTGTTDLMNLFSLLKYSINNVTNWDEINLNYYCDYHFSCNEILKNSVLLNCYYNKIKGKFEYEGNVYEDNTIPYSPIDLSIDNNKKIYDSFVTKIDSMKVFSKMDRLKNVLKKYFISLCDYHVDEVVESLKRIEKEVDYYCLDAPIMCIAYYLSKELPDFCRWDYKLTDYIIFDKFELSNVNDKTKFSREANEELKELAIKFKTIINYMTYSIRNEKIEICFDNQKSEEKFEEMLIEIADTFVDRDVRRYDILDIIEQDNYIGLKKIYTIDAADANTIINNMD